MPIRHPNPDERRYQRLVDAALRRIPVNSPEWTNYHHPDPGVTLVQLFAWLADSLFYRLDRIPESGRAVFERVAARVRRRGRCTRLLISGGNKKTRSAAARFITSRLGLNLYRIDLSGVVNKYIGETEKNFRHLFDAAKDSGAILFFDEADALFGKGSEAKDSHDRYANQDIAWLLQRLERQKGLVILATNRKEKPDAKQLRELQCDLSMLALNPERSTKARGSGTK
jgi:SpoVK/Ycf46/Vps4 family AAA+-type ATPase